MSGAQHKIVYVSGRSVHRLASRCPIPSMESIMIAPSRGGGQSHTRWASIRLVDRLTRRQGAPAHGAMYTLKAMAQMMRAQRRRGEPSPGGRSWRTPRQCQTVTPPRRSDRCNCSVARQIARSVNRGIWQATGKWASGHSQMGHRASSIKSSGALAAGESHLFASEYVSA